MKILKTLLKNITNPLNRQKVYLPKNNALIQLKDNLPAPLKYTPKYADILIQENLLKNAETFSNSSLKQGTHMLTNDTQQKPATIYVPNNLDQTSQNYVDTKLAESKTIVQISTLETLKSLVLHICSGICLMSTLFGKEEDHIRYS